MHLSYTGAGLARISSLVLMGLDVVLTVTFKFTASNSGLKKQEIYFYRGFA